MTLQILTEVHSRLWSDESKIQRIKERGENNPFFISQVQWSDSTPALSPTDFYALSQMLRNFSLFCPVSPWNVFSCVSYELCWPLNVDLCPWQAGDKHYHPSCARCSRCNQMFTEGEEMYLQGEHNTLMLPLIQRIEALLLLSTIRLQNYTWNIWN